MFDKVSKILKEFAITESSILFSDDVFVIDDDLTDLFFDMGEDETTETQ